MMFKADLCFQRQKKKGSVLFSGVELDFIGFYCYFGVCVGFFLHVLLNSIAKNSRLYPHWLSMQCGLKTLG